MTEELAWKFAWGFSTGGLVVMIFVWWINRQIIEAMQRMVLDMSAILTIMANENQKLREQIHRYRN